MLKKLLPVFVFIFSVGCLTSVAQTGSLKVTVSDKGNNETIPGAAVIVEQNGTQAAVAVTDFNGECMIKPIIPGKYTVKIKYVGYQDMEFQNVLISSDKTSYLTPQMSQGVTLTGVDIVSYVEPLVDPDTKISNTVTREEFDRMANKDVNSVAATGAGIFQSDAGGAISVRGARSDANVYFIDGQRVIGSVNIPQQGIEQITTITGGLPAQYGDATGGVISITTRGPSSKLSVGTEGYTSELLDKFGYNQLGFSVTGPVLMKKDTATGTKKPVLGFFVAGQAIRAKDGDPSAIGYWKVKDDVLKYLEENPLRPNPTGGYQRNAEFITKDDMEQIAAKQNSVANNLSFSGKMDFKPTANLNITFGGSVDYSNSHAFIYQYMLFNPVNNPQTIATTWRTFGRLTQKFSNATAEEEEKSASLIKNAFYSLQVGYSESSSKTQDDTHKDNLFDYGYIGKFTQRKSLLHLYNPDGPYGAGYYQAIAPYDDTLTFEPGDKNPTGVNYTEQFYNYEKAAGRNVESITDLQQKSGSSALINGGNAQDVYGMWLNTGRQYPGFNLSHNTKFDIMTSFSADIKNHAVQAGFEYDQRASRAYSLAPINLWTMMRNAANFHLKELDTTTAYLNTDLSGSDNYWDYNLKYDAATQKQFDKSLREKLGMPVNSTEWLDIDSYDPTMFSIDMFGADDLLFQGNGVVGYFGYDHTGKKLKKNPSLDDFFTKKDDRGSFTRSIGAYQPIYVAGYIQDKFDFRDLKFNLGVRIDRFDANQKVLKDKYLLYEAKTAGEVTDKGEHPGNIGDDYVVYVNDRENPNGSTIVGYRHESTWYNADGTEISDPAVLAEATTDGRIAPYLLNPDATEVGAGVFKDYDPQINVMPRLGLSFPISDEANFFAHYDIIVQRPSNNRFDPSDYFFLQSRQANYLDNPDLKPQKTVNYELGFTQVLNEKKNSALTLSAFYLEKRDLIQLINVAYAYPKSYFTYGNIDFSTVKGLTAAYDLRRTGNVSLTASYTLQFAEGTGSGANDNLNLVSSGQPNLRFLIPLNIDQRHAIKTNIDYRFAAGSDYNGPVWVRHKGSDHEKTIQILSEMGANLTFNAGAGTPYNKRATIGNSVSGFRSGLKGSPNGSSLPWMYRFDLRLDKNFDLEWNVKDGEEKKKAILNVNITFFNLLNTKNIQGVYGTTGNPDDDGYLASADGQRYVSQQNNPQSYTDLYSIFINNPANYSLPRRTRLGFQLSF